MITTINDVLDYIYSEHMTSDDRQMIVDAVNVARKRLGRQVTRSLGVGSTVTFYSEKRGRTVIGRVDKVNKCTVHLTENDTKIKWRVSPELLKVTK